MREKDYAYEDYREIVEEHLLDFLPEIESRASTVDEAMKYSLTAGGKRLRPVLLLASCVFSGGTVKAALPYACAIEYLHTYSLIHDDLPCMDNDDLRRGKPTNHKVYGEAMAVLAGDGLLSACMEAMQRDLFMYFDDEKALKRRINASYDILHGGGCTGMLSGQVADVENEGKACSRKMLDFIHSKKTGALITAAVRAGCRLGGADRQMFSRMTDYAESLGLAFQIRDDMLDVEGSAAELGKSIGKDAASGKNTYPALYGMEQAQAKLDELEARSLKAIAPYYDNAEFFKDLVEKLHERRK